MNELISTVIDLVKRQAQFQKSALPAAVVFDLDGTLVDVSTIQYLVESPNRSFFEFHSRSIDCPPHLGVHQVATALRDLEFYLIVLSGRTQKFRKLTDYWLAMQNLDAREVLLRPDHFIGNKVEFKSQSLAKIQLAYNVLAIFDDDAALLDLWMKSSIPIVYKCPELLQLKP